MTTKKWILIGIPVLWVLGALMHFAYDWSGKSLIVGIFAPVNESVWEHLKMVIYPTLIWWLLGYLILGKKAKIDFSKWLTSCVISLITAILFIIAFFYTYTGAFGIESLFLDILSLILGILLAQLLAMHFYNSKSNGHRAHIILGYSFAIPQYNKAGGKASLIFSILIILLIITVFTVFTFAPPKIPLFLDMTSNKYGI